MKIQNITSFADAVQYIYEGVYCSNTINESSIRPAMLFLLKEAGLFHQFDDLLSDEIKESSHPNYLEQYV